MLITKVSWKFEPPLLSHHLTHHTNNGNMLSKRCYEENWLHRSKNMHRSKRVRELYFWGRWRLHLWPGNINAGIGICYTFCLVWDIVSEFNKSVFYFISVSGLISRYWWPFWIILRPEGEKVMSKSYLWKFSTGTWRHHLLYLSLFWILFTRPSFSQFTRWDLATGWLMDILSRNLDSLFTHARASPICHWECKFFPVVFYGTMGASLMSLSMVTINRAFMLYFPTKVEWVSSYNHQEFLLIKLM